MPIYILLFSFVSLILMLGILVFWLTTLALTRSKRPPNLRFRHLMKVTFVGPLVGSMLSCVPVAIVTIGLKVYQQSELFADIPANWSDIGSDISNK